VNDHFIQVDAVIQNAERSFAFKHFIQALDDGGRFCVVQNCAEVALALFDLVGGEWLG
jgi:hypothetical protein